MKNVVLCGVGGQGTVLASRLVARAAMGAGLPVKVAETIGMAQRGGSVLSHIRLGEGGASPLVGRGGADLVIGFEPAETARQLPYLREGGFVVASDRPVVPVSVVVGGPAYDLDAILDHLRVATGDRALVVDAEAAFRSLGSTRVLNVVLLGAAVESGTLGVGADDVRDAVCALVSPSYVDLNICAFEYGMRVGRTGAQP